MNTRLSLSGLIIIAVLAITGCDFGTSDGSNDGQDLTCEQQALAAEEAAVFVAGNQDIVPTWKQSGAHVIGCDPVYGSISNGPSHFECFVECGSFACGSVVVDMFGPESMPEVVEFTPDGPGIVPTMVNEIEDTDNVESTRARRLSRLTYALEVTYNDGRQSVVMLDKALDNDVPSADSFGRPVTDISIYDAIEGTYPVDRAPEMLH